MKRPLRTPQNQIKTQLRDALCEFLFQPIEKKLANELLHIAIDNTQRCFYPHYSFVYKGKLYLHPHENNPPPRRSQRLADALVPRMEAYLQEEQEAIADQASTMAAVPRILNSITNPRDCLRILPEAVHPCLVPLLRDFPATGTPLSEEQILELQETNMPYINMMKQRLILNLLI